MNKPKCANWPHWKFPCALCGKRKLTWERHGDAYFSDEWVEGVTELINEGWDAVAKAITADLQKNK